MTLSVARLGDPEVAAVILGQSPPSSSYNSTGVGFPFFQGKADFGLLTPTPRTWCNDGPKRAVAGDVLLSVRAPVGDVNIAAQECIIGRGISALRAGSRTDSRFLYFAMLFAKPVLESRATGSTFASVNGSTLLDLEIPFPAMEEQTKIGIALHELVNRITLETSNIDAATQFKRAAMHTLFTHGLRGEAQNETEIGLMPESWDVIEIGELGRIGNGSTPKKSILGYWNGGKYPWLTSGKIYDGDIIGADQYVTDQALSECHLPRVQAGSVLVAITGQGKTLGHAAVLGIEATINQHLAYITIDTAKAVPHFVKGFLETQYTYLRQVGAGGGSTKGALTCAFLRGMKMPLPHLEEQHEIVAILDTINSKIDLHRRKRAMLDELFKTLLHKLMTGEIRVSDLDLSAVEQDRSQEAAA